MGLDIYLYSSSETKDQIIKHSAAGDDWTEARTELHSAKYPEHYWKLGYFRSSYNDSGIDQILRQMDIGDLSYLFGAGEDYIVFPDWTASRARLVAALGQLNKAAQDNPVKAICVSSHAVEIESASKAIDVWRDNWDKNKHRKSGAFSCYENRYGLFDIGAMDNKPAFTPVAVLLGTQTILGSRPCAYLIIKCDLSSYIQAIEIAVETCDHVLAQPNPEQFYFHWSG